jgi:tRNA(Arg) A34 adenosine deaminase TadA
MLSFQTNLSLPAWLRSVVGPHTICPSDDAKMAFVIELSHLNVKHKTGGPFGAAVFNEASGRLLGIGVNRVLPETCSVAHAEMMAYMTAQANLRRARLNQDGARMVLATSSHPCCMCYGATFWAGIDTLLIGARTEDVRSITAFDEGPLPEDWLGELEKRGIAVRADIRREQACSVLRDYGKHDGKTY